MFVFSLVFDGFKGLGLFGFVGVDDIGVVEDPGSEEKPGAKCGCKESFVEGLDFGTQVCKAVFSG